MAPAAMRPGTSYPPRQIRYVIRVKQVWRRNRDAALLRVEHIHRADRQVRGQLLLLQDGQHVDVDVIGTVSFAELANKWRLIDETA